MVKGKNEVSQRVTQKSVKTHKSIQEVTRKRRPRQTVGVMGDEGDMAHRGEREAAKRLSSLRILQTFVEEAEKERRETRLFRERIVHRLDKIGKFLGSLELHLRRPVPDEGRKAGTPLHSPIRQGDQGERSAQKGELNPQERMGMNHDQWERMRKGKAKMGEREHVSPPSRLFSPKRRLGFDDNTDMEGRERSPTQERTDARAGSGNKTLSDEFKIQDAQYKLPFEVEKRMYSYDDEGWPNKIIKTPAQVIEEMRIERERERRATETRAANFIDLVDSESEDSEEEDPEEEPFEDESEDSNEGENFPDPDYGPDK